MRIQINIQMICQNVRYVRVIQISDAAVLCFIEFIVTVWNKIAGNADKKCFFYAKAVICFFDNRFVDVGPFHRVPVRELFCPAAINEMDLAI